MKAGSFRSGRAGNLGFKPLTLSFLDFSSQRILARRFLVWRPAVHMRGFSKTFRRLSGHAILDSKNRCDVKRQEKQVSGSLPEPRQPRESLTPVIRHPLILQALLQTMGTGAANGPSTEEAQHEHQRSDGISQAPRKRIVLALNDRKYSSYCYCCYLYYHCYHYYTDRKAVIHHPRQGVHVSPFYRHSLLFAAAPLVLIVYVPIFGTRAVSL